MNAFRDRAEAIAGELTELRRALHREPELGLDLPLTRAKVLAALDGLPLEITTGRALTSVTAVLRGGRPGPAVLLRADMDALPLQEEADVDYRSRFDGVMHACGHDQHTAILVGAARLLAERREELAGSVVFMFQPGEEGCDGAGLMIEEGVLEAAGPDAPLVAAYSLHVNSNGDADGNPLGVVHGRVGTMTAGFGELHVTVHGRGGHGSTPHTAADPVPVAAELVTALQTLVTRTASVFDPVVLTVGTFHAGTRANIIPPQAVFGATVRAMSDEALTGYLARAKALCEGLAAGYGLRAEVEVVEGYPATINDAGAVALAEEVATELWGEGAYRAAAHPIMASEDFSRVVQRVPGAQLGLSSLPPGTDPARAPFNHSSTAVFDDGSLPVGAALLATMASRRLTR